MRTMKPHYRLFLSGLTAFILNSISSCASGTHFTRTTDWGRERSEYEEFQTFDRRYNSEEEKLLALNDLDTGLRRTRSLFDADNDKKWDVEQQWKYDDEGDLLESTIDLGYNGTVEQRLLVEYAYFPQPEERSVYEFGRTIHITRTETKFPSKETLLLYDEQENIEAEISNCYEEKIPYEQKTRLYQPETGELIPCE